MFRKYRWILYSAVLFLVSSAAFAATNPAAPTISADAVTNQTDLSINFLSQIFGTVGNVLVGTSGQMLGKLFYEFNIGILVVASLWLSYSVLTLVMGSASEGSFMGRQNNIAYTFLRIAIGMGALIPSPTTGYCVIQDIVMEVVVQGVALADMTWSNGINYIQAGGSVWTPPTGSSGGAPLSATTVQAIYSGSGNNGSGVIAQVFSDEVCMNIAMINSQLFNSQNAQGNTGIANSGNPGFILTPTDNQQNSSFDFPSSNSASDSTGCGSINWGQVTGAQSINQGNSEGTYAYQASYQVVYGLLPTAKEYACTLSVGFGSSAFCQSVNVSTLASDMAQAGFAGLLGYVNAIGPLVQFNTSNTAQGLTDFFNSVNNQGWVMAGRYSWDLAHLQDQYSSSVDFANYLPPATPPSAPFFTQSNPNNTPSYQTVTTKALSVALGTWPHPVSNTVLYLFQNYTVGSQAGDGGSASGNYSMAGIIGSIFGTAGGLIGDIIGLQQLFESSNIGDDPLYFLHRVGIMCMGVAGEIWINIALIVGALYVIGIVCSGGFLDLDKPIQGIVDWVKPILMGVAGIFIATGGMLAFYVPVYAFFLFTFAVIGWFIAVIEAVACAPMIAFGLTHPEGHDLLGPAKQALILLLGVFLRPALIIIGLIGGMILSFVAFRMVNYGFASFLGDIFTGPGTVSSNASVESGMSTFVLNMGNSEGGLGGAAGLIIGMPVMMIMYTGVVFLVANQCYSLIYVLPDYILRWIGGQSQSSGIGQMVEGLKGGVSQTSSQMGQGAGDTIMGTGRGISSGKQGSDQVSKSKKGSQNISNNSSDTDTSAGTGTGAGTTGGGA